MSQDSRENFGVITQPDQHWRVAGRGGGGRRREKRERIC